MLEVDPPLRIRMTFRSGPHAVRSALARILSELEPLGLSSDDLASIEIVLAEALNNVVEHAYPAGGPGGPVEIRCRADCDGLHVRIIDDGHAMPGGAMPEGRVADLSGDVADLPEGGFGWHLISKLARDIRYHRKDERNILKLRLPVSHTG